MPDGSASCVLGPFTDLPRLPRDAGGPVFAEPWQAQAFALAVNLSEQGHFTWKEWAAALARELEATARRGQPDDGSRYYEHWLAALEQIGTEKGLADSTTLQTRKAAWGAAYQSTGALVALVVTTLPSAAAQLSYLLLFGVGSTVGMATLSGILGWPIALLGAHHMVARAFSLASGSVSIALGLSLGLAALRRGV